MKQSQKQTHTIEVLYELALSIGTSLDLQQMLATSMQAFAEELDCAVSTTYRSQATEAAYQVEAVGTYSPGADKAETEQLALANLPATPAEPQLTQFKEALPLVGAGADDDYYHLLDLPGFGFLLLVKDKSPLDEALLAALRPLQDKLATAAAACAPAVATPVTTAGVEQSQEMVHEYLYMHRGLYEINNELMHLDDMDELYRRVVELAHTRLGFERVGMYLLNEAKDALVGTYGVDDSGNVRSEQGPEYNITNPETIESYVFSADRLSVQDDAELFHDNVVVGRGWQIGVAMWVDETPIGVMFADNLITGQPLKPYQAQLLFAYSSIVASLIVRHRTDESIHERETLLRTIIDSTPDWIFVKDRDHRYQLVNKGYADTMGMPPEEFIGKNDLDVGFPEEIVKGDPEKGIRGFWADDNEIMAQGELKIIDEEPAVIDGEQRYLHTVKAPLKDADDEVTGLVGFVHDITKQKATAEALEAANAHTETILQAITVPVLISRVKSGEIGYANEHLAELVRMPLDQLVGNATPNFYVRNEDRTAVVGKIQKVGSVNNYQLQLRRTDGEAFWALLSARLIDFEGEPAIITSLIEITDRIEAEQSLRQSEKELSQALEIAKLGYWEYDVEKDIFTLNDQFYTVYGMTAEQHGGYQVSSEYFTQHFVYPDDQMVVGEEIARAVNSTEQHYTRQIEHRILFPDGSVGYIVVNVNLERDEQGTILRFYGANQDITTLKQAELRLQENQSRLAEANRISNLYPWEFDIATEMFTFTPEYFELLGISVEENGGLQISAQEYVTKFVPPEEAAIVATEVGEAMATDDPNFSRDFESVNLTTDGKIIPVRVRFRIEKDAQGNTIKTYGANQDISEQKAVEATLAKQAEELQTVAEVATNAASAMDEAALLQDVVSLTKERFNLYHAHIYLLDEAGENLVLTAGAGVVGQQMVADGRSIPFDQEQSLVARAARTQQGVIVNDVRSEPNFLPNPLLPDTRAEMAVPMIVGTRVLGVLDVQADTTDYFTAQDVQIQTTLAAQMAVALENVRLLNVAQANEERYRTILDNANEIIFTLTPEGNFTYLSPAWTELLGYTMEEGEGHSFAEFLHPEDIGRAFTYMEELAAGGGNAQSFTYRQRHKNGDWRWFVTNGSAVKDEASNIRYFIGLAQDITEQRLAEVQLQENQERLAEANRISKLYPWEFDVATGMFTFIPEYFELLGTSVEENGGLQISAEDYATKFVPSEEAPIVGAEVGKAMLADDPNYSRDFESINLTAGGRRVPIYVRFRLEKDAQGNTIRLFGANQDITEQKEAELQLQENQQRLAEANRISKLYPWEFELETETFTFEPEYLELLGTSEEENGGLQMSAEEFAKYAPPEYAPIVAAEVEKVRIADDPNYSSDFEYVNLTKDGRLIPISVRIRIEKDVNGNTVKIFGVNQDITEQKAVEATLRQNEAELSQALELAKLGYWEYDVKNDLFTFNDQFYSLFHTTAEEHGGYRVSSGYYAQHFVHPDDTEMVGGEIGMALSSTDSYYNRQLEHRILYADGGIGYISVNVNVERDEQGDILRFYGANQDITDRKLAEVAVAKQAKELQVVAELSTTVATTLEQEKLLQQVIDLTKERFDFYHAQIYLLDAQHEKLSLAFGAGDVGRQLVSQKHQIDLNAVQSLVAQAARSGQAIVVNAVRENPNWLANALLPETQAEMAVPMMVGNHVLGVLDVQSEVVNRFTEQDVQIQTTLAAQVSIALENARSFEQAQTAVAEMNALTRRLTHEGWDDYFDTVPNENLRFLFDGSSVQEAQDTAVDSALPENPDELLERPIEIRGVKIGKMAIVPEEEDTEMEEVVNSVMQQLASHIENLRLTEQVQTSLAQTEALYTGSERIVLSSTEEDILQSLVLSTELRKLDRANIFMFDEPVEDGVARDVMVVATWVNEGIPPSVQVGTRFEVENVPFLATVRPDSTLVIRDVREDSRVDEQTSKILEGFGMISFTMFPIVVGSQWLGIVSGQSSKPLYMNDVHLRQATSLVSQAAVVMQTTILFRQEQARARREQMLREIAAKVRSSTDVDTIMRTAVTEIGRTLGRRSFIKLGNGQLDSQQNDNGNGATS